MTDSFTSEGEVVKFLMNYYISKVKKIVYSRKNTNTKYKQLLLLQIEFKKDIFSHIRMSIRHKEVINYIIQSNIDFYAKLTNINTNPLINIIESIKNIHL